jgi:hypothetical protein
MADRLPAAPNLQNPETAENRALTIILKKLTAADRGVYCTKVLERAARPMCRREERR